MIHGNSCVIRMDQEGGRHVLKTDGGRLIARGSMFCTNGYSGRFRKFAHPMHESGNSCRGVRVRGMMEKHPEHPRGTPAIRTIAMPADTNPSGDIFGGWLMSQMDLAAGNLAALIARGRSATIAVDAMKFHRAVKVGDEVSLYAELQSVGRTSMKIHVEAWRRCRDGDETEKVTEATFTFVALDNTGRARPVHLSD